MKLFVDFWKFTKIWKGTETQNCFYFEEDIDLSDIYLAVQQRFYKLFLSAEI